MGKQKTHEEFIEDLSKINPNIEAIDLYVKSREKILVRCKICNNEWYVAPYSLLAGNGCRKCYANKLKTKKIKTDSQFINELKEISSNIQVIGKYINAHTKIKVKCLTDNYVWDSTPSNLLRGYGCPNCAGKRITTESFVKDMNSINSDIQILGKYENNSTKIKCFCKIHKEIFYNTPSHLKNGQGCCKCKSEKIKNNFIMSNNEFISRLNRLFPNIKAISEYNGSHNKVYVFCKKCQMKFTIIPNNAFTRGIKCNCKQEFKISHGELRIFNYLFESQIKFDFQKSYDELLGVNNGKLSYDFYLPDYNILIEFQGEQHQRPLNYFGGEEKFKIQQEHDRIKYEYAKNHNINLIEIWYWDFKNIDNILEDLLTRYKK